MKVKICGVCRAEDAKAITELGADYMGVILAHKSPRQQSVADAMSIYGAAGTITRVGVFADQEINEIADAVVALDLDFVQLHGTENSQFINELECAVDVGIWKSVSLKQAGDLERAIDEYGDHVDGLLLDSASGGSGQLFDWKLAARAREVLPHKVELIVAGGLTPENVRDVVASIRPDVVDVASGVERKACEKSRERMEAFLKNAKQ